VGRVRIFAGPNGSGKTTVNEELKGQFNLGYYLNADDLCLKVKKGDRIDLSNYSLSPSFAELESFFCDHNLYPTLPSGISFKLIDTSLEFFKRTNMYEIAILADYLRHSLLKKMKHFRSRQSFPIQTKSVLLKKQTNRDTGPTYILFPLTRLRSIWRG